MKTSGYRTIVAIAALLIWLVASGSGMDGHYCFDGQAPKVSIHLDSLSAHTNHDEASAGTQDQASHQDMDMDLSEPSLAKLFGADSLFIGLLVVLLAVLRLQAAAVVFIYTHQPLRHRVGLRPPLRAPPVLPA